MVLNREYKIDFDDDICISEQRDIVNWIADNQPNNQQNIILGKDEYIVMVVRNENGKAVSYRVKKPKEINVPKC